MSPNTLEREGLINQHEYQKVAALTQSASPDAQKKIAGNEFSLFEHLTLNTYNPITVESDYFTHFNLFMLLLPIKIMLDFLGKVKDKAGDMEKRLKDKDKHGTLTQY